MAWFYLDLESYIYLVIFHLLSIILYIYLSFFTFNLPIRSYKNYYHSRIYTSLNDMNSQPSLLLLPLFIVSRTLVVVGYVFQLSV